MGTDSSHFQKLNALIIKKNNFGESHTFFTLFDESLGRISVSAYGARKEKSLQRADLIISHQIEGQAFRKTDAMVYNLQETKTVRTFPSILSHIRKVSYLYLLFEIIDCLPVHHEQREIFQTLIESLSAMETSDSVAKFAFYAIIKIFGIEGILPDFAEGNDWESVLLEYCHEDFCLGNGTMRLITDIQLHRNLDFLAQKSLSASVAKNMLEFIGMVMKSHYGRDLKTLSIIRFKSGERV